MPPSIAQTAVAAARVLSKLPPFRGLPNPREVFSWGMFDLANQSFTLLVNTLLFGPFLKLVVLDGHAAGDFYWSLAVSLSMLVVVVSGPVLGAWADAAAMKKRFLVASAAVCVAFTIALGFLPAGSKNNILAPLLIAYALYIPANIAFNLGENFLASFLPEVSSRKTMGRVSAIGWTMGYIGALVLLALMALASIAFGIDEPAEQRPLLIVAGLWFAIMVIPTIVGLPERAEPDGRLKDATALKIAFVRIRASVAHARSYPDLLRLLAAFFVYAFGVQTVIFFAGIIITEDFQFEQAAQFLFLLLITITAGLGAVVSGRIQNRLGYLNTIIFYVLVWLVTTLGVATLVAINAARAPLDEPPITWPVWICAVGVGIGLGGIGTATRAAVGLFTPAHRTGEFFGLWGLTYKLAGMVGVLLFGAVRTLLGSVPSLIVLAGFFVLGAALLAPVRERRGSARAEQAELLRE